MYFVEQVRQRSFDFIITEYQNEIQSKSSDYTAVLLLFH